MLTKIEGYAAVWYVPGNEKTQYVLEPGVVERIMPGAFDKSLSGGRDIILTYQHIWAWLLGRTDNRTLELKTDSRGLHYKSALNDTDPDHMRSLSKLRRGDVSGSSFTGFFLDRFDRENGLEVRWVDQIVLLEVAVVTHPAYEATSAMVSRSRTELAEQARSKMMRMKCDLMAEKLAALETRSLRESTDGERDASKIFKRSWESHRERIAAARSKRDWKAVAELEYSQDVLREAIGRHNAEARREGRASSVITLEAR